MEEAIVEIAVLEVELVEEESEKVVIGEEPLSESGLMLRFDLVTGPAEPEEARAVLDSLQAVLQATIVHRELIGLRFRVEFHVYRKRVANDYDFIRHLFQ